MRTAPIFLAILLGTAVCISSCGGIAILSSEEDSADVAGAGGRGPSTGPIGATSGNGPSSATVGAGGGNSVSVSGSSGTGEGGDGSATGGHGQGGGSGGADCAGSPCVIAEGFVGADLEHDGTHLYLTTGNDSRVLRLAKQGGPVEALSDGDGFAGSLALMEEDVFWAGEQSVFRAPKSGGPATVLATPGVPLGAIVIGGSDLYFVDRQDDGRILAVPTLGGEIRVAVPRASLANDVGYIRGIKNWDSLLWVSSDDGRGELHGLLLDGASKPTTLLGGMSTPGSILHANEGTYVTEPYVGTVSRVSSSGIGEFLVGTVDLVGGLAIDDEYLYITEAGTSNAHSGRILRLGRFEATGIDVLAEDLHSPRGIVVDQAAIYWLEGDPERAVMRLAKP